MRGFPAFAVCFAMLFQVWWRHYKFFRAYDLEDGPVIALTGLLLFVVLFYVYPLKFLWTVVFAQLGGSHAPDAMMTPDQAPTLFAIYGARCCGGLRHSRRACTGTRIATVAISI